MVSDADDIAAISPLFDKEEHFKIPENYECEECGKTFKHRISWVGHQARHRGGRKTTDYACDYCDSILPSQNALTDHKTSQHLKEYEEELPISCEYCYKRYKDNHRAKAHMKTHTEQIKRFNQADGNYICEECGELFNKGAAFYHHINSHDGYRMFICAHCGSRFQTEETLRTHTRLHTNKKMFKCDVCDAEFHRKINLQRHAAVHIRQKILEEAVEGIFNCSFCVKVVFRSDKLQEHEIKHADPANFFCCICGCVFKDKAQMNIHETKHITSTGKIKCLSTSKSFDTIEELTEFYCNNLGANRKFKCKVCMAEFNKLLLLKEHQLTHDTQEIIDAERKESEFDPEYEARLFECDECGKRFKRNCHLKVHKTVHERELDIQDRQQELIGSFANYMPLAKKRISTKPENERGQTIVSTSADTIRETSPCDSFTKTFFAKMAEDMKKMRNEMPTIPSALEEILLKTTEETKPSTISEGSSSPTESSRKRPHNDIRSSSLVALVKEKVTKLLEKACVAPVVSVKPLQGYPLEDVKPVLQPVLLGYRITEIKEEPDEEPYEETNELEFEVDQKPEFVRIDAEEPGTSEFVESRVQYVSSNIESVMKECSENQDEVMVLWIKTFNSSLYKLLLNEKYKRCVVVLPQKTFNTIDFQLKKPPRKTMLMKQLRPNFYVTASRLLCFGDLDLPKPSLVGVTPEDLEKAFLNLYEAEGMSLVHLLDYEPEDEDFHIQLSALTGKIMVCNFNLEEELHVGSNLKAKQEIIQRIRFKY